MKNRIFYVKNLKNQKHIKNSPLFKKMDKNVEFSLSSGLARLFEMEPNLILKIHLVY